MKYLPVLLWIALWSIVVHALTKSDGSCQGVCDGCMYSGDCPQERR
jgi:hypothetical protein